MLHHVSVEASAASNGEASAPLFEDRRFQAFSVPVAVELLLIAIDQCRHMLQAAQSEDTLSSSMKRQYDGLLPARERRILDAAVTAFWHDVTDLGRRELERLGLIGEQAGADDLIYPLAQETAFTLTEILIRKIKEDAMHRHFDAYRGDELKAEYIIASIRLGTKSEQESTLGGALLCLLVSKMEEFVGALVRVSLALYPNILGELPSVPDSVITRYRANISSSDLRRWQIDQKITNLLKGSPGEWQSSLEKRIGIDIAAVGGDWSVITEMVQRRHTIVHNNGRADDEYMTKVDPRLRFGLEPGSLLMCNVSYMMPILSAYP